MPTHDNFSQRSLSPIDAVGPAISHLKSLFIPFRPGVFLKVCLVGAMGEFAFFTSMLFFPLQVASFAVQMAAMGRQKLAPESALLPVSVPSSLAIDLPMAGMASAALLLIALMVFALLCTGLLYLVGRVRIAFFQIAYRKQTSFKQAWAGQHQTALRYLGANILLLLFLLVLITVLLSPFLPAFVKIIQQATQNPGAASAGMTGIFLGAVVSMMLLAVLGYVLDAVVHDLVMTPLAVEAVRLSIAVRRAASIFSRQPGSTLGFIFMRTLLGYAASICCTLAGFIPLGLTGALAAGAGYLLYRSLWTGNAIEQAIVIGYGVVAALVLFALYTLVLVVSYGIAALFRQLYALAWLGGRYPQLEEAPAPSHLPSQGYATLPPSEIW